jgi:hypothetical protein
VAIPRRKSVPAPYQKCSHFNPQQFGSFALYGLYLIIKYYGSEWINLVLKWYFSATGVGSVWAVSGIYNHSFAVWYSRSHAPTFTTELQTLRSLVRFAVGKTRWRSFERYSLRYIKGKSKGMLFFHLLAIPTSNASIAGFNR